MTGRELERTTVIRVGEKSHLDVLVVVNGRNDFESEGVHKFQSFQLVEAQRR